MSSVRSTQRLSSFLGQIISNHDSPADSFVKTIIVPICKCLETLDESWSVAKQEECCQKCINEINCALESLLPLSTTISVSKLEQLFEEMDNELMNKFEGKTMDVNTYAAISKHLSQLREALKTIFSQLIDTIRQLVSDNTSMKQELTGIKNRLTFLEAESATLKKNNFVADLMAPAMSKIHADMKSAQMNPYQDYTASELTRVKEELSKKVVNEEPATSDELSKLAIIIQRVAKSYGIIPLALIEQLQLKQSRNNSMHYNVKMKCYARSNLRHLDLKKFVDMQPELCALSEIEIHMLQPIFVQVCQELLSTNLSS